jgi:hypothetical protein
MPSLSNIDDLLNKVDMTPDSLQTNDVEPEPIHNEPLEDSSTDSDNSDSDYSEPEPISNKEESQESTIDDYGQPANKKEKMYSEAEVQQMMRDRNARGEFARQEAERLKQEAKPIEPQETGDSEDWEQQFESLVEQTLSKREQKQQEQQWQAKMQQEQAEFEIKFNTGAAKYADFESVVVGKPLTPSMVIATKAMKDPAAFIYAASKTQAHELERISKIDDKLVQAVELGKLEERMRKGKNSATNAPKPIEGVKGDVSNNKVKPRNIDDLIREDAKRYSRR